MPGRALKSATDAYVQRRTLCPLTFISNAWLPIEGMIDTTVWFCVSSSAWPPRRAAATGSTRPVRSRCVAGLRDADELRLHRRERDGGGGDGLLHACAARREPLDVVPRVAPLGNGRPRLAVGRHFHFVAAREPVARRGGGGPACRAGGTRRGPRLERRPAEPRRSGPAPRVIWYAPDGRLELQFGQRRRPRAARPGTTCPAAAACRCSTTAGSTPRLRRRRRCGWPTRSSPP